MSQTKYMMSGGLAFSEDKDMAKLRRFSLEGWHVKGFSFMGYTLEKGESLNYIYTLDYRWLMDDEEEEYFEFFSSSGWSHVASKGNIHLFRAPPDTKPIYTDRDTTVEKYKNPSGIMLKMTAPLIVLTALAWIGVIASSNTLETFLLTAAIILSAITVPAAWTAIRTYSNKWKSEGRTRLANAGKTVPFLLLLAAVMMILFVRDADSTVDLLTSAVIGGIAFPAAIWIIISVFTKWGRKRE